jgi:glycosyltransferase involved in cell wall biosynthesis
MRKTWKGKHIKKGLYHYAFERVLIDHASAIHYTTQLEVQESNWLALRPPYFVIPNPVSLDEFKRLPARGLFRQKWKIAANAEVLLFLGRIEPRKGLDILLAAYSRTVNEFPKARLVLAGPEEDNYNTVLQDMASKLSIARRMIFTGYLNSSERLEALADTDLFVLTSYSENFGMSVVEAMASGVPVVLSDQVGIAEVVESSRAGLVTTLNVESIADALRSLLQSKDKQLEYGRNAVGAARKYYAPNRVARAMALEFTEIIAKAT